MQIIVQIRSDWKNLNDKLTMLSTVPLPGDLFEVLTRGVEVFRDASFWPFLPLPVAKIRYKPKREILNLSRRIPDAINTSLEDRGVVSLKDHFSELFNRDIGFIHETLFGTQIDFSTEFQVGRYMGERSSFLHVDGRIALNDPVPFYIARVSSLPTNFISYQDLISASDKDRQLIQDGKKQINKKARNLLRKRGIITISKVNTVYLILGQCNENQGATLHCSSPVPIRGVCGGFFSCQKTQ